MFENIKNIFANKSNKSSDTLKESLSEEIKNTNVVAPLPDESIKEEPNKETDGSIKNNSKKTPSSFEKEINNREWYRQISKRLDIDETDEKKNTPIKGSNEAEKVNLDSQYSGEKIHFACTKCGKCCKTPPKVEFEEILRLKDDFIFQTNHTCFISYNKKPLPKEITDFYSGLGHSIVLTDLEAMLFYFIEFTPMINPSYNQCPKLVDNKCSIYERRPNSCSLYPFSKSYEQEQQWRSINFFKQKTLDGEYACDFTENAPIIYDDYSFQDYRLETNFEDSIQNIHNFTNYYIKFLEKMGGKEHKNMHFKYLVNAISQNSLFISDTLNPLLVGIINKLISKEDAISFVNSQINLINKELELSKNLKSKENLHTSRLYTKQKAMFEKALLTDMFDVSKYKI